MIRFLLMLAFILSFSATAMAADDASKYVKVQTSKGDFVIALTPEASPATVQNFMEYVQSGHYDRTIIHRVVPGFVIQGGGYSQYFNERPTRDPVPYEGGNGLKNTRGTVAMARTRDPQSARAQWYVNLKDNENLDHRENDLGPIYGYTVFGNVVEGIETVDAIASVSTGPGGPFPRDVPLEPVIINTVELVDWPIGSRE
ncbi:MAG: peptidylprolyl isomerase [Pseudomonadota bacterium]